MEQATNKATIIPTINSLGMLNEIIAGEWKRYKRSKKLTYTLKELNVNQKYDTWQVSVTLIDKFTGVSAFKTTPPIGEIPSEEIGNIIYKLFKETDALCGFAAGIVTLSLDSLSKINSILAEAVRIYGYYNESYISEAYASYRIDAIVERPCWRIFIEIEDALTYERTSEEFFIWVEMRADEVADLIQQKIKALNDKVMDKREDFLGEGEED